MTIAAENRRYPWLWDVDLDDDAFREILAGRREMNGLDWKWAMARLIEYAPWRELRRLLPEELFVERWPEVAARIRSPMQREGCDFLREYLRRRRSDCPGVEQDVPLTPGAAPRLVRS